MPVRTLPAEPVFAHTTEAQVFELLRRDAPDGSTILANLRLTSEQKDHELDLVLLVPDVGVVVIEVKGGSVWVDGQGSWWQGSSDRARRVHPVNQARDGKYALRAYAERDARWRDSSRTRVRWAHAVVTPNTAVDADFATPDCPRWTIHGREDMADLVERLVDAAGRQETGHRVPTEDDVDLICEIVRGRHLMAPDVVADAEEREAVADRLTQEQALLLKVARLLNRVEVRGGAGSGKTILALTQAKDLTRGGNGRPTQRVALLCYSIGLASYLKRAVAAAPRRHRPAFVGTFHELGKLWGAPDGDREDSGFWEVELPQLMGELAGGLPDKVKFDAVVVDEAQDFAQSWWAPLLGALRDEETGGLHVYSDENQRIFPRFGEPPVELVPLVLDHNLRNTRQIAETFSSLAPMRMRLMGGTGPGVTFVQSPPEEAVAVADDQVETLLDEGWQPQDIALLTTGHRHPQQTELQESRGQEGYWESFWDDDQVFYGHVLGCKGLERRAVVLCVNEAQPRERSRERLYVGMSRATDRLVLVGDAGAVQDMGGPDVARALGI